MWSRQAFLDDETILPELPAIGRSKQDAAVQGLLQPHDHGNAFEVVLVESGQLRWWVEDEELTLSAGTLFLTRPGETHGAVDRVLEPSEIRWAQFRLDMEGAFGLSPATRADLRASLNQANRTGRATDIHRHHLKTLLLEHQRADRRRDLVRAHAVCFLEEAAAALNQPYATEFDSRIAEALTLMRGNLGQSISVPSIAAHVDLSESWFHQLFQRSTGLSVGDWLARERIERAKTALANSHATVTEVALELGFSSSQYFATVFKKLTGQTPRDFRKAVTEDRKAPALAKPLRIVPYDPDWVAQYEDERRRLLELPECPFLEIEHVGSTAVPGLDAKPVIDMMASAERLDQIDALRPSLAALGYDDLDGGFQFRRSFARPGSKDVDAFHLHVVTEDDWAQKDERLFRDWLRGHKSVARQYSVLKKALVARYALSMADYTTAKSEFIRTAVNDARRSRGLPERVDWSE